MNMELQCPQCGKWMAVSQEELVMHDSQVVCPQCLAVCRYENGALVVRDDSEAPYRHTAVVDTASTDASIFCHNCGKQLPAGIRFCPYCGVDLKAPFTPHQPQPVQPQPTVQPPVEEKKPAAKPKKESQPERPQPAQSGREQATFLDTTLQLDAPPPASTWHHAQHVLQDCGLSDHCPAACAAGISSSLDPTSKPTFNPIASRGGRQADLSFP